MAITNHERVGKSLDLLRDGLLPYVEREMKAQHSQGWLIQVKQAVAPTQAHLFADGKDPQWDVASLLAVIWDQWQVVFKSRLGQAERTLVSELRDVRNRWAHQNPFSGDDAYRALDSVERLLNAVSAVQQSEEAGKMKMELLRVRFDEQARSEIRRGAGGAIQSTVTGTLKPWREVVTPHKDVASGRYQLAEFAADLWQVHVGEGSEEYKTPAEFFRRTYLTESLRGLLTGSLRRLAGEGGDPVVQLQTNFGGGKTHSMLALYHLYSGVQPGDLLGVDSVMNEVEVKSLPKVNRVVLVGNKISPGNPSTKSDGTKIRTLWGELAWQLGFAAGGLPEAKKAFQRIQADDENSTNPGDLLRELFNTYSPCLILVDEWVAYARQLHDTVMLPGGNFETQFTFAQTLTESAKMAKNCLLVVSLPASDTTGSPHAVADDVEVGGERGRVALDRLRNAVGRVEASWRPASPEEGFEIVRRRLFEPLIQKEQFVARDLVVKEFAQLYQSQHQEFPPECRDAAYEQRLKDAYPIHPEIFDRLYGDWSTLVKFQRTRGVLRLMAAVIHSLWEREDRNPLIMPGNISIDDSRVRDELTRYLSDNWAPIIEKDVDGPHALPRRLDGEIANLGKYAACRRVARTIYLGSAPTAGATNRGLEDRRIKLGCVMPGESPAIFGDALRRLASAATYLYADQARYWYSTQPTVTKMAEDRAEQLRRDPEAMHRELEKRIKADIMNRGEFSRIHPLPLGGQDVPDDLDARLVVLGPEHPYSKDEGNPAEAMAKAIFESRGNSPRIYRNAVVFLAADKARLQDLDEAIRRFLAWRSIFDERESLSLSKHQAGQAENQVKAADTVVAARLPETYQWLLLPTQAKPQDALKWQAIKIGGQDALAVRASKKLRSDELLITVLAGTRLKMDLDKVPLWRGDHVSVRQLVEDFGRYLYLPRVKDSVVVYEAVANGLANLNWAQDTFAYADSFDEGNKRYLGLVVGQPIGIGSGNDVGLVVKAETAAEQLRAQVQAAPVVAGETPSALAMEGEAPVAGTRPTPASNAKSGPTRYHATVILDADRVGRDASRVADEVIAHLTGIVGAQVQVSLEIQAIIPAGAGEQVVRVVSENGRALKFKNQGFESE